MKKSKMSKEKYKIYNLGRKGTPESGMELNPVFKDINRLRNEIKGVVTCSKGLKKSSEQGVVVHAFNSSP